MKAIIRKEIHLELHVLENLEAKAKHEGISVKKFIENLCDTNYRIMTPRISKKTKPHSKN